MANATDTSNEVPPLGPKMLALTAKQQGFVSALYDEAAPVKGDGLLIWAVRRPATAPARAATRCRASSPTGLFKTTRRLSSD